MVSSASVVRHRGVVQNVGQQKQKGTEIMVEFTVIVAVAASLNSWRV